MALNLIQQSPAAPDLCPSCGAKRAAQFCQDCGERRIVEREFGFSHFMGQAFAGLTTLDGRLLGSVRSLLFSPGLLTADWVRGARVKRLQPFQLFLLVNLVAVLLGQWFDLAGMSTNSEASSIRSWHERMTAQAMRLGLTEPQYTELYQSKAAGVARATTGVIVPVAALASYLLHFRRERRPGVHLVLGTHAVAFVLIVPDLLFHGVCGPLLRAIEFENDLAFLISFLLVLLPFMMLALWWFYADRRLFQSSRWGAAWRSGAACLTIYLGGVVLHQALIFQLTIRALE